MIVLIDNYDSFVYNLYQFVGSVNPDIQVYRNDEITIEKLEQLNPEAIVLSPGPGKPSEAGNMEEIIKHFSSTTKILGVCLGHQAICEVFGGTIIHAPRIMHGKTSVIDIDVEEPLFKGLPDKMTVARYHSLIADNETLPDTLKVIGLTSENEIMAVRHKDYPVYGVQFHPESILTKDGMKIIENFLSL